MKRSIAILYLPFLVLSYSQVADADILELRYTIQTPLDSTQIITITPVGDFNADGYGDLALGIRGIYHNLYSGVFLYYGGPAFDDQADLIFEGLPQDTIICGAPEDSYTGYGGSITGLGDYNGDGYDDFAVGSSNLCYYTLLNGAVYIYLGSPSPDTTVDIFIPGEEAWDVFGCILVGGNFNGDSFGDLFTLTYDLFCGQKVYVFLGSNPANGQFDWKLNYIGSDFRIGFISGGRDINDDGYDDFLWDYHNIYDTSGTMLFFGGDPIDTLPYAVYIDTNFCLEDDISGDGVDDFIISTYDTPPHLDYICLGGDPFNTVPDYGIPINVNFLIPSVFTLPSGERKFVMIEGQNRKLRFYNAEIPFDTTNYEFYYYGFQHGSGIQIIGDIDGIPGDEIVIPDHDLQLLNIYSGVQTGIDDYDWDLAVPENQNIISAYPNPFNAACRITVSDPDIDQIEIYDITGRLVEKLRVNGGEAVWNAAEHTSGIYFARAEAGDYSKNVKLVLLK